MASSSYIKFYYQFTKILYENVSFQEHDGERKYVLLNISGHGVKEYGQILLTSNKHGSWYNISKQAPISLFMNKITFRQRKTSGSLLIMYKYYVSLTSIGFRNTY